jgi:hypothetical protein
VAPAPQAEVVTVEVLGFAAMPPGLPLERAHREALLDARRNAVVQAHVSVQADAQVENMRLKGGLVRAHAAGYVESMNVLEAGVVPESGPPTYRVRVRAAVRPLADGVGAAYPPDTAETWRPVVTVSVVSGADEAPQAALQSALQETLSRCGLTVVPPGPERPALSVRVKVMLAGDGPAVSRVSWSVGAGETAEGSAVPVATGDWTLNEPAGPDSAWWARLGVAVAQDSLRLWSAARDTEAVFPGTDPELVRRIEEAFSRLPATQVKRGPSDKDITVKIALAGDPRGALAPLLDRAGLSGRVRVVQASLTRLVYEVPPAEEAP